MDARIRYRWIAPPGPIVGYRDHLVSDRPAMAMQLATECLLLHSLTHRGRPRTHAPEARRLLGRARDIGFVGNPGLTKTARTNPRTGDPRSPCRSSARRSLVQ
jgi:hypothetical protein